jgi:hypothetical protein
MCATASLLAPDGDYLSKASEVVQVEEEGSWTSTCLGGSSTQGAAVGQRVGRTAMKAYFFTLGSTVTHTRMKKVK